MVLFQSGAGESKCLVLNYPQFPRFEEQKQQYDRFPANLTLALLRTTGSGSGYLSLGGSFPRGAIGNKDREMIILRVGALSRSPYERMQHLPLARQAGWRDAEIAAIEAGHCSDERSQAILRFVDECVRDIKVGTADFCRRPSVSL